MLHLLLKFHHQQSTNNGTVETIAEHQTVISEHKKVWWGAGGVLGQARYEEIKSQLEQDQPTFAFLYGTKVPKSSHTDGVLWYLATLVDIKGTKPTDLNLIPTYYRFDDIPTAFCFSSIKPIPFGEGETPKVPGQTTIRYVQFEGTPEPLNLVSASAPDQPLCRNISIQESGLITGVKPTQQVSFQANNTDDVSDKIIDLQAEIIDLQREVLELRTYRDYYNKILGTDYLFNSEKLLESWIVENVHKMLPEIEILDQQPHASWKDGKFGRLDLLAVNKETHKLTIIEVKTRKRTTKSGYDQFVRYTSWAKRNIPQLAEKYGRKNLSPNGEVEFVIISDFVNDEMKAICHDHGIRLIKVFGGLGFESAA